MALSIDAYRQAIGLYNFSDRNCQYKIKRQNTRNKMTRSKYLVFLFILLSLQNSVSGGFVTDSRNQTKPSSVPTFNQDQANTSVISRISPEILFNKPSHIVTPCWSYNFKSRNTILHSLFGNRRVGYKIGLWNCRKKLISESDFDTCKLVDIKNFFNKHNPHIFCIVESDIFGFNSDCSRNNKYSTEDVISKLAIEGYKIVLPKSWTHFGQARILVYIKEDVKVKIVEDDPGNHDLPSITMEIGLGREKRTIINFFYREWQGGISKLNSQASQSERLDRLVNHWKGLSSSNKDVLILGDANLCAYRWNDDDYNLKNLSNIVHDFLLEESFFQLVKDYTRSEFFRGNIVSRSCIDHVYSNTPLKCDSPRVDTAGDSDHMAVTMTKFSRETKLKPQTVRKRNYKNFNLGAFLTDVWDSGMNEKVTRINDMEEAAVEFQNTFKAILDKHAPVKTFQIRKHYLPYLSDETKLLMEERDVLKQEATYYQDSVLLSEYKKKRNAVKESVEADRKKYLTTEFENEDSANVWKAAYKILGQNDNKAPTQIIDGDEMIHAPAKMANAFNKIFLQKVEKIRDKTVHTETKINPVTRLKSWLNQRQNPPELFELKPLTKSQLRKVILKMKGGRCHGVDDIDSYSLKVSYPLIEDAMLHLVNLSITQQTFAKAWKVQLVMPLHKKSDKMIGSNYRPVAHIVEVGKIVEYAIHKQVYDHFENQELFHPNHHGFLGHHSTATALIQLYDIWLEASEKTELSAALLLDLTAAFDVVDHFILFQKLETYNFSSASVSWFASYLSSRVQLVQVESKYSDSVDLGDYGIPQGSILGPLIFLIFNNDFPASSVEGTSVLFADDDTDNTSDKDPEELQRKIQREANRSTDWVGDNNMACAGDKTKLLIIGTRQLRSLKLNEPEDNLKVVVCGSEIKGSESERLLGLVVNNQLTWRHYLSGEKWRPSESENYPGLFKQLSQRVGMLKKLVKMAPIPKFRMLCQGIFYSKVLYCLQVYGNTWGFGYDEGSKRSAGFTLGDARKLQVLQNSICRMMTGLSKDTSTKDLMEASGELSIHQLTAYHTLLTVHKTKTSGKPEYLNKRLQFTQADENFVHSTRQLNMIYVKQNISREVFMYRGGLLWIHLPDDERKLGRFKARVKSWVKQNVKDKPGY